MLRKDDMAVRRVQALAQHRLRNLLQLFSQRFVNNLLVESVLHTDNQLKTRLARLAQVAILINN